GRPPGPRPARRPDRQGHLRPPRPHQRAPLARSPGYRVRMTKWQGALHPAMPRPPRPRRALLATLLAAAPALAGAPPAAPRAPAAAPTRHVVIVGLSGLRWSDLSPTATPTLWHLAGQGSVASLVDYAVLPLTCPADGWLTLNSGARAQTDHTNA